MNTKDTAAEERDGLFNMLDRKINADLVKQSGRKNLPQEKLRIYCVSVRLNSGELALLDRARGKHERGEAMRMAALTHLPKSSIKIVPPINAELATNIGKCFGNLQTLAGAMRSGEYMPLDQIKSELSKLQLALIGG
jgi:hypothetical protein